MIYNNLFIFVKKKILAKLNKILIISPWSTCGWTLFEGTCGLFLANEIQNVCSTAKLYPLALFPPGSRKFDYFLPFLKKLFHKKISSALFLIFQIILQLHNLFLKLHNF